MSQQPATRAPGTYTARKVQCRSIHTRGSLSVLTLNIGPLVLGMPQLLLMLSLLLAVLTGWWVGRRHKRNPERQVFRLLILALVVSRLAFVLVYFEDFSDNWWGVLDIRDGGFIPSPGILRALLAGGRRIELGFHQPGLACFRARHAPAGNGLARYLRRTGQA